MRLILVMLAMNVVPLTALAGAVVLAALGAEGWGWLLVIAALFAAYPITLPEDVFRDDPPKVPRAPPMRAPPPPTPPRQRPPPGFQGRYHPPARRE